MTDPAHPIQGLYEVCIGVTDPDPLRIYWEQFGYRLGAEGELSASLAQQLYGVNSPLRSLRLYHQTADHGLIRLMVWARPLNEGLGLTTMKVRGNRWSTTLTADIMTLWNHAEVAAATGLPIRIVSPQWTVIYPAAQGRPFLDPLVGVREMLLLQPLTRQVLFERFNYTVPHYGQIAPSSPLQASQVTHMGLVIQDDSQETLHFYDEVLGLLRVQDSLESTYDTASGGRPIFDLQPQERFWVTAFDDPRSSKTDWRAARSGRLYIVRFPASLALPDAHDKARPGCLGMSLYTYRVMDVEGYCDRIHASVAQHATDLISNEFGERSFSFTAPDGYFWTLIEG
jgi:catechol 2,3-dioxygenase-like lactoylglutathione lyase family enzyme